VTRQRCGAVNPAPDEEWDTHPCGDFPEHRGLHVPSPYGEPWGTDRQRIETLEDKVADLIRTVDTLWDWTAER
jgi:hypothetical protein